MSSTLIITIILLMLVMICLVLIFLNKQAKKKHTGLISNRFTRISSAHSLSLSGTDQIVNGMIGIDYDANKLIVIQDQNDTVIGIDSLKTCRKQKKWLHIPADNNNKSETHLEKIVLSCTAVMDKGPVDIVFYEYRYNSIFQMQELDQRADYWELLINQQMKNHVALQA